MKDPNYEHHTGSVAGRLWHPAFAAVSQVIGKENILRYEDVYARDKKLLPETAPVPLSGRAA